MKGAEVGGRTVNPAKNYWLIVFAVVSVAHLVLLLADASPWGHVTKFLIAPTLAMWVLQRQGPSILIFALLFCLGGDIALDIANDNAFLVGMASFAVAHLLFIRFFVTHGAVESLRRRPWLPACYAIIAILMIDYVWSGLDASMRGPIVVYAALLAATAATSTAWHWLTGVGGTLFFVSDGLIALGVADRWQPPPADLWVMGTYILALLFLATGITLHTAAKPDPTSGPIARRHGYE